MLSCKRELEREANIKNPNDLEATMIKKVEEAEVAEVEVLGLVVEAENVVVSACWLSIVTITFFSILATSAKTHLAMYRSISQKVMGLWKFT